MTALPWANFAKHNHSVLECVQTTDSFARAIFFLENETVPEVLQHFGPHFQHATRFSEEVYYPPITPPDRLRKLSWIIWLFKFRIFPGKSFESWTFFTQSSFTPNFQNVRTANLAFQSRLRNTQCDLKQLTLSNTHNSRWRFSTIQICLKIVTFFFLIPSFDRWKL